MVTNIKASWADGNLYFKDLSGNDVLVLDGDTAQAQIPGVINVDKIPMANDVTGNMAFTWQNPFDTKVIVDSLWLHITTGAKTGATIDVGIVANDSASADTLIDGLSLVTTGVFNNIDDKGSNGKTRGVVDENGGASDWITGKIAGNDASPMVGNAYLRYFKV